MIGNQLVSVDVKYGEEGGIRTLARFNPTNGLANRPLEPLGYLSESGLSVPTYPKVMQALDATDPQNQGVD